LAFLLAEPFTIESLHIETLKTEPLLLVASPKHCLADRLEIRINDIHGQTVLLAKTDCSYRKVFERILAEEKVQPASMIEFNSIEALEQSVAAGVGITIIPRISVMKELNAKQLTVLETPDTGLETSLLMIWHKDKWISPILKAFIHHAREMADTGR